MRLALLREGNRGRADNVDALTLLKGYTQFFKNAPNATSEAYRLFGKTVKNNFGQFVGTIWESRLSISANVTRKTTHPVIASLDHPLYRQVTVAQPLKIHGRETMKFVL